ncbi:16S rRNA (cytidine(1402)-2'-O)-methyltransferase [Pseudomonas sp. C27(2019)]|nr:16S rRNA (cytidine(1402)-2'-O)-methyltransferase [Pseudomonas sp. C27(2019)]
MRNEVFIDKQSEHIEWNALIVPKRAHWCDLVSLNQATIVFYFAFLECFVSVSTPQSSALGTLYVVATPIGNLDDISARALRVLADVSLIAAEDTRHSTRLLQHFGIRTPLAACHEHNEREEGGRFITRLLAGEDVALISDAGTPLISDPGYHLVRQARAAQVRVVPVPGACALIAGLSAAGLPSDRFVFEGFLPAKQVARCARLTAVKHDPRTLIFYEAPHRLLDSVADMRDVFGAERPAVLARELTKAFETIQGLPLHELHDWIAADSNQQRGECVLLIAGYQEPAQAAEVSLEAQRVLTLLMAELPPKRAAAIAAEITGVHKKALYQWALDNKPA